MKKNRREFLKISGMTGIALAAENILPGYNFAQEKSSHAEYDRKLADKYGLTIHEPVDQLDPSPEWLQNADMITADWIVKAAMQNTPYSLWKGYSVELEDILVERIVRLLPMYGRRKMHEQIPVTINGNFDGTDVTGVALISHVPHSETAFKQAHQQGFKVIPYVHFSCIHSYYADQDIFLFQHPEILAKDIHGKWVHLSMDDTDRLFRYKVCANSPSYWKLALAYVKKLMDWGADGVFIDNIQKREECFAPNFTNINPEFDPYVHEHLFPDSSQNYALDRFLQAIRSLVKSYGNDKVSVINSGIGTEFQKNGDCCTWESFIYSWAWEGRDPNQNWARIKERSKSFEGYIKGGRRITALSYLNTSRKEVKDDAYYAFCAARLLDMIWWCTLRDSGAEQLYQVHMGKSLQPLQEADKIAYRTFENGLIVLNDDVENKTIKINLPSGYYHKQLLDIFDDKKQLKIVNGHIEVTVPMQKGRIFYVLDI